jgi:signal peptidase I
MGMPGDSLQLAGDSLYVNGLLVQPAPTLKHDYLLDPGNNKKLKAWAKSNELSLHNCINGKWKVGLTIKQKHQLAQNGWVDSLILVTDGRKATFYSQRNCYNTRSSFRYAKGVTLDVDSTITGWNEFSFGPLYIPKKGKTIALNQKNLRLYWPVIKKYEGHHVEQKNGAVFINGKKQTRYRFTQNYYFMLGDNRCHSSDSRSWGFVPESHIIGKAEFILFSNWHGTVSWERFFKSIK